MPLQLRWFFSLSLLLLLLAAAAWIGLHRLTADLKRALDDAGLSVGRAVVAVLDRSVSAHPGVASGAPEVVEQTRSEHRVILRRVKQGEDGVQTVETLETLDPGSDPPQVLTTTHRYTLNLDREAGALQLAGAGSVHRIDVPRGGLDQALAAFTRQVQWGVLLTLALGLLIAFVLARRLAQPLRALAAGAAALAQGRLGHQVPLQGAPELRTTLAQFNRMSQRLAELSLEQQRLRKLEGLGELAEVGRGMAHSLRNPLHTLGMAVEALAAQCAEAKPVKDTQTHLPAQDLKQRATDQIRRIDDALRGLLLLGSSGAVEIVELDVRELLDDLLLEASQRAAGAVRLQVQQPQTRAPLRVLAHELRAALQALLVNAIEASPAGGAVVVTLTALAPDRLQLSIVDEGAGLDPGIRERLFTAHATTKPEGAGMGLFLAHRILVDRYAGRLELRPAATGGVEAVAEFGARRDG